MGPVGSLPYSQEPATGPYPQSDESSPQRPSLFPYDPRPERLWPPGRRPGPGREAEHSTQSSAEVKE